ncbi:uncharacterized protein LOC122281346 [Carya illinoinensis]|uniref:uncharacterized protein LOC122281346 n=1 Tax=Carya illinoinensis TaxID=32201 RepID=UPI001C7282DA|nr:uncharacterized protein LOC122281346 [Carya illinoinensis]
MTLSRCNPYFHSHSVGLSAQPVISSMKTQRHVFLRFSKGDDYHKAFAQETRDINGSPYCAFKWSTNFIKDKEPSLVPVFLPGLPANFYHESYLQNLALLIGTYLKGDKSMRCATRTDGARFCVEMDAASKPIDGFWIGIPRAPSSHYQPVIYETLPAYCCLCKMQGYNSSMCKKAKKNPRIGKEEGVRNLKMNTVLETHNEGVQKGDLLLIEEIEEGDLEQGNAKAFEIVQVNLPGGDDQAEKDCPWAKADSPVLLQDELASAMPLTLDEHQAA